MLKITEIQGIHRGSQRMGLESIFMGSAFGFAFLGGFFVLFSPGLEDFSHMPKK